MVRYVMDQTRGIEDVVLSIHCHDDLGQAVANSLAAVKEGAAQVECTINGVGERAGNASLEEIVMALRRAATTSTPIRAWSLRNWPAPAGWCPTTWAWWCRPTRPSSAPTPSPTGRPAPGRDAEGAQHLRNHEPVGRRAGREQHRPGQDLGPARVPRPPEADGLPAGRRRVPGRLQAFKEIADRKKTITDRDLEAIVQNEQRRAFHQTFELLHVQVSTGTAPCRPRPCGCARTTARSTSTPASALVPWTRSTRPSTPREGAEPAHRVFDQLRNRRHRRHRRGDDPHREQRQDLQRARRRHRHPGRQRPGLRQRAEPPHGRTRQGLVDDSEATLLADASGVPGI